jgi:hypothetical protein
VLGCSDSVVLAVAQPRREPCSMICARNGVVRTLTGAICTLTGAIRTLTGVICTLTSAIRTLIGVIRTLTGAICTLTGAIRTGAAQLVAQQPRDVAALGVNLARGQRGADLPPSRVLRTRVLGVLPTVLAKESTQSTRRSAAHVCTYLCMCVLCVCVVVCVCDVYIGSQRPPFSR